MMQQTLATALALAAGFLVWSTPADSADPIGDVDFVQVWAYGTPPGSGRDAIFRGHRVVSNETLETVSQASLQVTFVDGTTLALGESTTLVLDEFVFDPNASDSMVAQFANGLFHLVSGAIDEETVRIETPAMAIGLRGTDIVVKVDDEGNTDLAVRSGNATATPTAGGETVVVEAGQTASASPGDNTIILVSGLPSFATTGLPAGGAGFRNLGGGAGDAGTGTPSPGSFGGMGDSGGGIRGGSQ